MKTRRINNRYDLVVPDHVAEWDAPDNWERPRFESMESKLERGMVLYDIGAEHGWMSALYAREYVGGENMVLVEPTLPFWPNIRRCWMDNDIATPAACFTGLVAPMGDEYHPPWGLTRNSWPVFAYEDESDARPYVHLHENPDPDDVPRIGLTALVDLVGVQPDALTIDVEGAELLVLQSGVAMLNRLMPLVWVSIHPDLASRDYDIDSDETVAFMERLGYESTWLGSDHEQHWLFELDVPDA